MKRNIEGGEQSKKDHTPGYDLKFPTYWSLGVRLLSRQQDNGEPAEVTTIHNRQQTFSDESSDSPWQSAACP
jgi:hypothetical protein